MITYLTHPLHGTHVAYSQDEVERCQRNGWKVREEPRKASPTPPPPAPEPQRQEEPEMVTVFADHSAAPIYTETKVVQAQEEVIEVPERRTPVRMPRRSGK